MGEAPADAALAFLRHDKNFGTLGGEGGGGGGRGGEGEVRGEGGGGLRGGGNVLRLIPLEARC